MLRSTSDYHTDLQRNRVGPSAARLASAIPDNARAVIEREPKSVTQSAPAASRGWRLRFHPRAPLGVDSLTGWTSGSDPLAHLALRFPDLAPAIRYAECHDLPYDVREERPVQRPIGGTRHIEERAPARLCCWPTGPHALCCGNYPFDLGGEDARVSNS